MTPVTAVVAVFP